MLSFADTATLLSTSNARINKARSPGPPFGSTFKRVLLLLLFLLVAYLFISSSKCWLPVESQRSIRARFPKPRSALEAPSSSVPQQRHLAVKSSSSSSIFSTASPLIQHLVNHSVKLIAFRRYKDYYLVLEEDVEPLKSAIESPDSKKLFSTEKKTALDPRLFNWEKEKHREKEILVRFKIASSSETVFISVAYRRGKEDKIDQGFYWIPSFGKEGKAKAFSRFKTQTLDGSISKPVNETLFEWEDNAAEFHECNYTRVKKFYDKFGANLASSGTIEGFMEATIHIRKLFASWGVYNWLASGSLLGWFRQCSAIPYTTDADTASWAHQYQDWMKGYFLGTDKMLHLWRKYGRKEDSLEFTFKTSRCRIDVFFTYEGVNPPKNKAIPTGRDVRYNWFGVQTFDNYKKGKSLYPLIERLCTAELHGYLVNIPCDPEAIVKAEYGAEKWFEPVKNYNWVSSPNNVVIDGKWTPAEWDGGEVYEKH